MQVLKWISFVLLILLLSCGQEVEEEKPKYLSWVGDIETDTKIDDPNFKLCNNENYSIQYFYNSDGIEYKGEKIVIIETFKEQYKPEQAAKENGLIRIRFIVNCKGETGRFRIIAMDDNYQEKIFDSSITDQLLRITKSLDGWQTNEISSETRDYYQYLIFKIEQGNIINILP